jgi:hypothetical protein
MRRLMPWMAAVLLVAATAGLVASAPADAHGHRSHVGVWFNFGPPIYYPAPVYYYPYPRYYQSYPEFVPPPQYIEQNPPPQPAPSAAPGGPSQGPTAGAPGQGGAYWYYCRDSQTYYPYVQTCASQWQQVVPGSGPPS